MLGKLLGGRTLTIYLPWTWL